jgi:hypothetical protein
LNTHCIACHGPDEGDRQADFRVDTFEGATADLGDYAGIAVGKPNDSEIIARVESDDEYERMPPSDHADPLSPNEIELLRRWIEQGAEYQPHWSFASPPKPIPPSVDSSAVVQNPIDQFILNRLKQTQLRPNPPALPTALIRRVCLDLTGLPPIAQTEQTRQRIGDYLADTTQANLASVVDALLDSSAYAEHWASMWLDIARYADSQGYAGDENRTIWPWRDWLIQALRENKPYDQFSIEMLAGDLLPNPTADQKLATAFHRNTLNNNEGGTNNEEFRTIAIKDRLSTTINAWMGLTVRCAECHSHKYDPISHTEYYQLLDFFNQTADADTPNEEPKLPVFPAGRDRELSALDREIAELKKQYVTQESIWQELTLISAESTGPSELTQLSDGSILATGPNPDADEYVIAFELAEGQTLNSLQLMLLPSDENGGNVGRAANGSLVLSQTWLTLGDIGDHPDERKTIRFSDIAVDHIQSNHKIETIISADPPGADAPQGWAVGHPKDGYTVPRKAILSLAEPIESRAGQTVQLHLRQSSKWLGCNLGRVRVSIASTKDAANQFRQKTLEPLGQRIQSLVARRNTPVNVPVMETLPEEKRRDTFVMLRGSYRSHGNQVEANFPSAIRPFTKDPQPNRLGLAKWIFSPDNPLTARVAVNRYWARMFGIGLVETEEDFGTQGTPPSHPQLLDWLAVEFKEHDWDVHYVLKTIVLSATYQQNADVSVEQLDMDPRNRLHSRGPRVRLPAEVVRDQALAVSGLLSQKMFGPPVYPPSPVKRIVNAFTGGMTWTADTGDDRYRRSLYTYIKRSSPHPLFETFDMSTREVCSMRRLRTNTPLQSFMTLNDEMFIEAARSLADVMLETTIDAPPEERIRQAIAYGLRRATYHAAKPSQTNVLLKLFNDSVPGYVEDPTAARLLLGLSPDSLSADSHEESPSEALDSGNPDGKESESQRNRRLAEKAAMTVVANVILNLDDFLTN